MYVCARVRVRVRVRVCTRAHTHTICNRTYIWAPKPECVKFKKCYFTRYRHVFRIKFVILLDNNNFSVPYRLVSRYYDLLLSKVWKVRIKYTLALKFRSV